MTVSSADMPALLPSGFDEAAFDAFLASRDEPQWLLDLRRRAFAAYQKSLQEELDPEEWKRIDLRAFDASQFAASAKPTSESSIQTLLKDRSQFAGRTTHINGHCAESQLADELADQGVIFGDLSQLAAEHEEILKPHLLSRAVEVEADRFSAWHAAFCTGGTVLYVPRNVELSVPLYSLIAITHAGVADFSHTLVIMEENSSATLLEETTSGNEDGAGLHVGAVELLLAADARLRYVQLQNWNKKTWHFAHQAGRVERNGSLQWTVGGLGSRLAHVHQTVDLDGPGAEAEVNGVTFATDRQVISYYTQQSHNAPNTHSDLLYKEVLRDRARVIWRGMIRVEPEAQKTDGYQRSDALMLSPTSRADAIPGLEIEADDVRCTHGATAGRVDEEQVFYCMSRGMTEFEAMHIIVEGFFHSIYDRIVVESVRETLSHMVEKKLGIGD